MHLLHPPVATTTSTFSPAALFAPWLFLLLPTAVPAQFAPNDPKDLNLTTVKSPINDAITVSYKTPHGACKTAFDHQQQYTGWVNVPSGTDGGDADYETNLFFWFVEAREPTTALTIWLNGGPGSSSMFGFFTGNGPCQVVEEGEDRLATVTREWGWDRASNMLFIDQPNQVGFSYDTPTEASLDLINNQQIVPPEPVPEGRPRGTFLNGTLSSLDAKTTANTTENAAMAVWHLLQGFLSVHPRWNPAEDSPLGVNLFAESYGGRYGPIFATTWERQNAKREQGLIPKDTTLEIRLKSLGIVNGCIDPLIEAPFYPVMAHDNVYSIEVINGVYSQATAAKFKAQDGCEEKIVRCRTEASNHDPNDVGNDNRTNELCRNAKETCDTDLQSPYFEAGRSAYDISRSAVDPFPPRWHLEYLNNRNVQEAIGSTVNYTESDEQVWSAFSETADMVRGSAVSDLTGLLDKGIRVALIYGDRDFVCNWLGGEEVSKEIAKQANGKYPASFPAAGYADIQVNDSYVGGVVRQYGNLSFSRIYQAGHAVASYQPETAFQVFARIIMGTAVSTGEIIDSSDFGTKGSANATKKLDPPEGPKPICWLRALGDTCDQDAVGRAMKGEGVTINGAVYAASTDWALYGVTKTEDSGPGPTLTGVYTATPTDAGISVLGSWKMLTILVIGAIVFGEL